MTIGVFIERPKTACIMRWDVLLRGGDEGRCESELMKVCSSSSWQAVSDSQFKLSHARQTQANLSRRRNFNQNIALEVLNKTLQVYVLCIS